MAMLDLLMIKHLKRPFHLLQPPKAQCLTKIWHPNIAESGEICLSLLRQNSYDGLGWAPTRRLKDVLWGLNSLFSVSILCSFYFHHVSSVLKQTV